MSASDADNENLGEDVINTFIIHLDNLMSTWVKFLGEAPGRVAQIAKEQRGKVRNMHSTQSYDMVVIGGGSAGFASALQAAELGAKVLILDLSVGGGSSQRSGGVIYLGGGTPAQIQAGFHDDPENMYRCLKADSIVNEERLRLFCNESKDNYLWLEAHGVPFNDPTTGKSVFYPVKSSLPPPDATLYFSGNETAEPWRTAAEPVPRGHWPYMASGGKDTLVPPVRGHVSFNALSDAVDNNPNIELREHCRAVRLIMRDGRVVGVKVKQLLPWLKLRSIHQMVFSMGSLAGMMDISGYVRKLCKKMSDSFFCDYSEEYDIFASGGVAICAGGFFFNDEMVKEHLPMYQGNMPLGCLGDDGSGIKLGEEVGAAVSMMHKCTAWRFLVPPQGFASAICVDPVAAKRFSNEDVYNAKLIDRMFARAEGRAWIILDSTLYEQILFDINDLSNDLLLFQRLFALLQLQGIRKGNTWKELANVCGLPSAGLEETVKYYNIDCHNGVDSNFGKVPKLLSALEKPPFYASWYNARVGPLQRQVYNRLPTTSYQWLQKLPILKLLSLGEKLNFTFPASPTFSLGGLSVDVDGHVLSMADGKPIPGLFAAGRSAVGVASGGYWSGLSLSDAIFSARRVGRCVAREISQGKSCKL